NTTVDHLFEMRNAALAKKDFAESDRIRGVLSDMGVLLRDYKDPVTGEPKSEIVP
ncbi:MAG: CysS/YqeB C-terminal domain-containing protein, partial [Bradyrhizobium sp.]